MTSMIKFVVLIHLGTAALIKSHRVNPGMSKLPETIGGIEFGVTHDNYNRDRKVISSTSTLSHTNIDVNLGKSSHTDKLYTPSSLNMFRFIQASSSGSSQSSLLSSTLNTFESSTAGSSEASSSGSKPSSIEPSSAGSSEASSSGSGEVSIEPSSAGSAEASSSGSGEVSIEPSSAGSSEASSSIEPSSAGSSEASSSIEPSSAGSSEASSSGSGEVSIEPSSAGSSESSTSGSIASGDTVEAVIPVTSVYEIFYTRSSNSSIINITQVNLILEDDDTAMMSYFEEKYGFGCMISECDENSPFGVNDVSSTVSKAYLCDDGINICYDIITIVNATRYPVLYSPARADLAINSGIFEVLDDRDIAIVSSDSIPQEVLSKVQVVFKGVGTSELDKNESAELSEALLHFLEEELGLRDPPILVQNVSLDSQKLRLGNQKRLLRKRHARSLEGIDIENELYVNFTIIGEYLPPPDIIFDEVIIDVLDQDGREDFIEAIDKSNNPYFEPEIENLSISEIIVYREIIVYQSNDTETSTIILAIVIPCFVILLCIGLILWYKYVKAKQLLDDSDKKPMRKSSIYSPKGLQARDEDHTVQ